MTASSLTRSIAIIALALTAFACNKEKPTKAIIHVKDKDGYTVPDAYVKLYVHLSNPLSDPSRLMKEGTTDSRGDVEFDYSEFYKQGQAGFAVLDIFGSKDTLEGEGIIKILEQETNEETLILEPVDN